MAKIKPFKGIYYNPEKIYDLKDVTAPPYDVISPNEQQNYYKLHPQNIIRLILGRTSNLDTSQNNRYTRAAVTFEKWLAESILIQDRSPALYLTSVEFILENKKIERFGLIALVGLEPFEKGIVLPHEKTFSRVKSERLELIKRCQANFSSIFSLYSDRSSNILNALKDAACSKTADMNFVDDKGQRHQLWRITDKAAQRNFCKDMEAQNLFIADGHHRYETALNYRNWVASNNPDFDENHPANYVMMYLCSMEDPGLIILPAHRILRSVQDSKLDGFIEKAQKYFNITTIPISVNNKEKTKMEFISSLKANASTNSIGVFMANRQAYYLLVLKPNIMSQLFGHELSNSLQSLDVIVLTRLIFIEILGFDQASLDNEKLISYSSVANQALAAVETDENDIAFILNSTKIEQVRKIAEEGLIMPRKSTYFFPKVITGQVINNLRT